MHGGSVEALSEGKDRGSEFIVRLPLSEIILHRRNHGEPERVVPARHQACEYWWSTTIMTRLKSCDVA